MTIFPAFDDEFREARCAWEKQYQKGSFLSGPIHSEIPAIVERFKCHGIERVLDHGCGSGRHTVYLAKQGFEVLSLDIAPTGLDSTLQKLATESLMGHSTLADIVQLPYKNQVFDAIISLRVIHHNRIAIIRQTVEEMWRVLNPHGVVWVTVPVPQGHGSKFGDEIEPGTWVPRRGIEKGLPHHLFTEAELRELFQQFAILDLQIFSQSHYSLLAEKPTT